MVHHHTYVIGGNSNYEYCGEEDKLSDRLSDNTCETCNTYNMLKLTRLLFELDAAGRARRMRVGENYLDAVDAW